ncbi:MULTISPECIES: hypothetical protein [unclassified Haloferax]|jgi:hypothetical protein|uniref:hypothetical protein n=1 Tax=unclassified Haloferax TaxID=2625095 RepID=UPI002874422F|nr:MULTISPECIES: hypothetical protein [unclassified Haloferax]MDS0243120.1 hypothetical protein [Haloferax sp. S2CR25]MDS0446241.1 hypothetical protein [Haloferax sp. S2CR25-2]
MSNDDWNPGPKYQAYLRKIQDILTDEKRTVRDVYYALEARGFEEELRHESYQAALRRHENDPENHAHPDALPASEWQWKFEYRYVKRAVKKGRRAGYIDPALIIDASRRAETTVDNGHSSAESFVDAHIRGVWQAYYENFWNEQNAYLEIWLEKQSLASIFRPIADEYNIRLEATRGDWSDSKVYEATQRLASKLEEGKDVTILYFGDFNPSGFHAPVSVQETMRHYGISLGFRDPDRQRSSYYFDIWPPGDGERAEFEGIDGTLLFDRCGISLEHIKKFDLPQNPNPSSTDKDRKLRKRFQNHISEGRDVNVELNALKEYQREYLESLVRESIEEHIDEDARQRVEERIEEEQAKIRKAIHIDDDVLGGKA